MKTIEYEKLSKKEAKWLNIEKMLNDNTLLIKHGS